MVPKEKNGIQSENKDRASLSASILPSTTSVAKDLLGSKINKYTPMLKTNDSVNSRSWKIAEYKNVDKPQVKGLLTDLETSNSSQSTDSISMSDAVEVDCSNLSLASDTLCVKVNSELGMNLSAWKTASSSSVISNNRHNNNSQKSLNQQNIYKKTDINNTSLGLSIKQKQIEKDEDTAEHMHAFSSQRKGSGSFITQTIQPGIEDSFTISDKLDVPQNSISASAKYGVWRLANKGACDNNGRRSSLSAPTTSSTSSSSSGTGVAAVLSSSISSPSPFIGLIYKNSQRPEERTVSSSAAAAPTPVTTVTATQLVKGAQTQAIAGSSLNSPRVEVSFHENGPYPGAEWSSTEQVSVHRLGLLPSTKTPHKHKSVRSNSNPSVSSLVESSIITKHKKSQDPKLRRLPTSTPQDKENFLLASSSSSSTVGYTASTVEDVGVMDCDKKSYKKDTLAQSFARSVQSGIFSSSPRDVHTDSISSSDSKLLPPYTLQTSKTPVIADGNFISHAAVKATKLLDESQRKVNLKADTVLSSVQTAMYTAMTGSHATSGPLSAPAVVSASRTIHSNSKADIGTSRPLSSSFSSSTLQQSQLKSQNRIQPGNKAQSARLRPHSAMERQPNKSVNNNNNNNNSFLHIEPNETSTTSSPPSPSNRKETSLTASVVHQTALGNSNTSSSLPSIYTDKSEQRQVRSILKKPHVNNTLNVVKCSSSSSSTILRSSTAGRRKFDKCKDERHVVFNLAKNMYISDSESMLLFSSSTSIGNISSLMLSETHDSPTSFMDTLPSSYLSSSSSTSTTPLSSSSTTAIITKTASSLVSADMGGVGYQTRVASQVPFSEAQAQRLYDTAQRLYDPAPSRPGSTAL